MYDDRMMCVLELIPVEEWDKEEGQRQQSAQSEVKRPVHKSASASMLALFIPFVGKLQ